MLLTKQNPVTGQLRKKPPVGMRGLTHWWPLSNKFNDKTITRPAAGPIYGVNTSVIPINGFPFGSDGGGSAFFSANPCSILLNQAPHGFNGVAGLPLDPFTISGWVNLGSMTSRDSSSARFVNWTQPTGEANNQIIVGTAIGGAADGRLCIHLITNNTTLITETVSTTTFTTGQWYHWAVTWDGVANIANIKGYVNGAPVTLTTSGGFFSVTANQFAIGARDVSARSLNGQQADIKYHRGTVLTPAEIAAIYQDGLTAKQETPSFVGVSSATVTGTLAVNETQDTAAFAGSLNVFGPLSVTESQDVAAFSGSISTSGTLAVTEAQDIAAFVGNGAASGTLATTEAQDIAAFAGGSGAVGTLAATETQDTAAFTGQVISSGTLAATETQDTASITGSLNIFGSLATTEAKDIAAFLGQVISSGTLATTEAQDIVAFNGALGASGTFAVTELPDTASFSGFSAADITGTFATTEAKDIAHFEDLLAGGTMYGPQWGHGHAVKKALFTPHTQYSDIHPITIREAAQKMSSLGGHARAASLTPQKRTQIATKAANTRWK